MKKMLTVLLALVLVIGMTAIGTAAPTDEGLLIYYSFDDESETIANGGTAEADGTAANITYADGAVGKAAVFNGMDSSIEFNLAEGMPSFTLSIWINVEEIPTDDEIPYAIVCSSAWDNSAVHTHITDGILRGSMASWKNADYLEEKYTHTRRLYINSTLVGEDVADSVDANLFKGNIEIGSYKADPQRYFNGMLDEFRLYDRALTQEEVKELTNQVADVDVIPEPTPAPKPTATPTPSEKPTSAVTAPNNTVKATNTANAANTDANTVPPTEETSDSLTWLWIVLAVVVVAVVIIIIASAKKKKK